MMSKPSAVVLFALAFATLGARHALAADKTVWDGVYTGAQANRGEAAFTSFCSSCHKGGFQGEGFLKHWREDKLSSLYNFISTNMPVGNPGAATKSEYIDMVAFILASNKFPAGNEELTPAAAGSIQVIGKNGPGEVPDGSLVSVVGCLVPDPTSKWLLTHASIPVRTRDVDDASPEELKSEQAQALGTGTFILPDVTFYHPDKKKGNKVALKGFLDREAKGDRILANSLQSLAETCP